MLPVKLKTNFSWLAALCAKSIKWNYTQATVNRLMTLFFVTSLIMSFITPSNAHFTDFKDSHNVVIKSFSISLIPPAAFASKLTSLNYNLLPIYPKKWRLAEKGFPTWKLPSFHWRKNRPNYRIRFYNSTIKGQTIDF